MRRRTIIRKLMELAFWAMAQSMEHRNLQDQKSIAFRNYRPVMACYWKMVLWAETECQRLLPASTIPCFVEYQKMRSSTVWKGFWDLASAFAVGKI